MIQSIKIRDLLDYEESERINIFEELSAGSLFVALDLIKIGNNCGDEEAESILSHSIEEIGLPETFTTIIYDIIGERTDKQQESIGDLSNKSFTDVLDEFYGQLQVVDNKLSLSDFWNMSTRYMYKYAEGVNKRYIYNKNEDLRSDYSFVAMLMSAVAGKLKECPQLNEDGTLHKKTLKEKLAELRGGR